MTHRCHARRYGDQMHCARCGTQWDVTDEPPRCHSAGEVALRQIREMFSCDKQRDPKGWGLKR